jgi:hypothetical protein
MPQPLKYYTGAKMNTEKRTLTVKLMLADLKRRQVEIANREKE